MRGLRKMARGCDARRTRTFVIVSVREWGGENEPLKCDGGEEGLRSSVASSSSFSKKSAHAMTGESGLSGIRQLTADRKPYLICDGRVNASGLHPGLRDVLKQRPSATCYRRWASQRNSFFQSSLCMCNLDGESRRV